MVKGQDDSARMPRHPIRVVSERTGLSPELLRAWEQRYGVVEPGRSPGGHRLYSDGDVERLSLLRRATEGGRSIGQVSDLTSRELAELVREDEEARARHLAGRPVSEARADGLAEGYVASALEAVRTFDQESLDRTLRQAALSLGTVSYLQDVAAPFLRAVGDAWHDGSLGPAQEHFASVGMRRVLDWLIGSAGRQTGRPRVVIGTPAGEDHEMGALLAAAAAESAGWEAIYLGPNLPGTEIAQVAIRTGARAVALSAVYAPARDALRAEIQDVRKRLAPSVTLLLGGEAVLDLEDVLVTERVLPVRDIPEFIRILQGLTASESS